ncbi:DUF3800 domain-containing protein [Thermomicrobiaceae bacterium CFH 74404]|uniref:DUF3800 domain-containing protein n=1 Tax=Thermalbibacter longus TaxID=2951981 RepID=A0AA41WBT6_9BACT|nr:DUF3800 domain-containing protein [Thermalbibacter longus]MCM8750199.1 DUF3800 domain-containing protein [Thermalbibacter longus]
MISSDVTHVGFSDESSWNTGRFGSVALITGSIAPITQVEQKLAESLQQLRARELKWSELRRTHERSIAEEVCKLVIDMICCDQLRVDVLVFDKTDSRHNVPGRDDSANLERLYYHLFHNVLRLRWPSGAIWTLYADEQSTIAWDKLEEILQTVSRRQSPQGQLLAESHSSQQRDVAFQVAEIHPSSSREHPLLQMADLFAGMAVFAAEHCTEFCNWKRKETGQISFWDELSTGKSLPKASLQRFHFLHYFCRLCSEHRLGITLESPRGLRTRDPRNPLNFWWYEPQHPADKAPTKKQG